MHPASGRMRCSPEFDTTASDYIVSIVASSLGRRRTYAVDIPDNSGDTRQTSATTGNNADVLVGVLTALAASIGIIVEVSDGLAQC